jgi:hypothetical protein
MSTLNGGPGNIVTNGLVLYLDAANYLSYTSGSTTWNDLSGNNNSGSLVNGPTFSSTNAGSIVFDGVNDYCDLATFSGLGSTNRTLCAWVKVNTVVGSNQAIIEFPNSSSLDQTAIHLGHDNTRIVTGFGGSPYNGYVYVVTGFSTNTWYNISCVISGSVVNAYTNGIFVGTATNTGPVETNPIGQIGRYNSYFSGNYSNCSVSISQLYNRALTASEVLQNYNATKARFGL